VLHLPHDVDVPALQIRGLVFQALERNANLDFVAGLGQSALGCENEILTEIGRRATGKRRRPPAVEARARLHDRTVHLHAERIHREDVCLSLVVKRAEQNLNVVIGRDLVAVGERGVHGGMALERLHADIQRRRRIPDQNSSRVGRRNAVLR
jgi:hypothetical protein